jgi:type III restriction enzyme
MYLKNYQVKVIQALNVFFKTADKQRAAMQPILMQFPNLEGQLDFVKATFDELKLSYNDNKARTGLGQSYPRVVIKVPTGGGKTLLAVEAIREYQNLFAKRKQGLVVWIVSSETIYSQTIKKLKDKSNPLRQLLDQCSGGNTLILEKGQRLIQQDINENLVVLFVMIQSIARINGKEALKVFQDSGGYESFFPADNRYDLHKELIQIFPNLDIISGVDSSMPQIKTSLGNAIRITNPLIIIDEIHKVFSDNARNTIDSLNPAMVVGFSATPKAEMNIIISISGNELKMEDMIKLDLHINPPANPSHNNWKVMLKEIKKYRELLEKKAIKLREDEGTYIRPIALLQVERTGKEQRTGEWVHSIDVKEELIELGINPDEIAIKTSSQNDIEDVDLFSRDVPIRYIITKDALREGWDCSFAYILGIIPNVNSNSGLTQLVGRILRQPNARKTKVKELDESYVYFVKGGTQNILEQVSAGFKNEGLEDLTTKVKLKDNSNVNEIKCVKIKRKFREKFRSALYIPVLLIIDSENKKRKFSYDIDIKAFFNFDNFMLSDDFISKVEGALSNENTERKVFIVTLDAKSKTQIKGEFESTENVSVLNMSYLTRRLTEIIENPFLARSLAKKYLKQLEDKIGIEKLICHFGFIVSEIVSVLNEERVFQEEKIFKKHIADKKLVLTISDDEKIGCSIPETDMINVNPVPHTYNNYLYEDVELSGMNSLEKSVGSILDKQEKILWWFRNKISKGWYSIQGWQKYKIRPDFIAAKKSENGTLELVYVLESKGEMLLGNLDTTYKDKVMKTMNNLKIKTYQNEIPFNEFNDKVEFYLIEENKEESAIKKLMA